MCGFSHQYGVKYIHSHQNNKITEEITWTVQKSNCCQIFSNSNNAEWSYELNQGFIYNSKAWKYKYGYFSFHKESRPECRLQPTLEKETLFLNGSQEVTLSCEIRYWGICPHPMHWNTLNGKEVPSNQTIVKSNRNMNIKESSIRLSAKSEFLTQAPTVFTFTMFYFEWNSSDGVAEESNEHRTNYSKYKYVWYSPNISKDSREYSHHILYVLFIRKWLQKLICSTQCLCQAICS